MSPGVDPTSGYAKTSAMSLPIGSYVCQAAWIEGHEPTRPSKPVRLPRLLVGFRGFSSACLDGDAG